MTVPGPRNGSGHWPAFWNDPFLEPKQQHRFLINFPIFMPSEDFGNVTPQDSMLLADDIINKGLKPGRTRSGMLTAAQARTLDTKVSAKFAAASKKKFPQGTAAIVTDTGETAPEAEPAEALIIGSGGSAGAVTIQVEGGSIRAPTYSQITEKLKVAQTKEQVESIILDALQPVEGPGLDSAAAQKTAKDYADTIKNVFNEKGKLGPNNPGGSADTKVLLRVGQYLGVSFTPPAPNYQKGTFDFKTDGTSVYNPSKDSFDMGDAKITMVTTLQDDLHFSLNLLYALASLRAGENGVPSGYQLFNDSIYVEANPQPDGSSEFVEDPNRILTIVEYAGGSLVPSVEPSVDKPISNSPKDGIIKPTIVGIHKLRDPMITGISYGEYSYGSNDLMKITINLGYGSIKPNRFYSYEVYNNDPKLRRGRWDPRYHSHNDYDPSRKRNKFLSRQRGLDGAPDGSLASYYTKFPNWWSDNDAARQRQLRPFQRDMSNFRTGGETVTIEGTEAGVVASTAASRTSGNPHIGFGELIPDFGGQPFEEGLSRRNARIREIAATYQGYATSRQAQYSQVYSARKNGIPPTNTEQYSIPEADKLNSITTRPDRTANQAMQEGAVLTEDEIRALNV